MQKKITPILVLIVVALSIALFLRGGEVITALYVSTTNSSAVTVNISNTAPTCAGAICYDEDYTNDFIDLLGGTTRKVACNATCNDANGAADMITFRGQLQIGGAALCTANTQS